MIYIQHQTKFMDQKSDSAALYDKLCSFLADTFTEKEQLNFNKKMKVIIFFSFLSICYVVARASMLYFFK